MFKLAKNSKHLNILAYPFIRFKASYINQNNYCQSLEAIALSKERVESERVPGW